MTETGVILGPDLLTAREHGATCRCAPCRHERFNPGPPSMTRRQARNRAHDEALIEDAERARAATPTQETK